MSRQRLLTFGACCRLSVLPVCSRRGFLGNVSRSGVRHLDIFCADLFTNTTAPLPYWQQALRDWVAGSL